MFTGITVENRNPIFKYENGQGPIDNASSLKLGTIHVMLIRFVLSIS